MKLKYLQSWRFKVVIMLKRKHLKFLHSAEVQTFLGTPHLPQVAVHIVSRVYDWKMFRFLAEL